MSHRRERGLTLVEIMVVVIILMILSYALYLIVFNASVTYTNQTRLGDIQDRARTVLDAMAKELRQADLNPANLVIPTDQQSIRFRPVTGYNQATKQYTLGNTVEYVYDGPTIDIDSDGDKDAGRIVRIENGTVRRTLTEYVKPGGMTFTRTGDTVAIQVTFITADYKNRPIETTLTTAATLRNDSSQ